MNRTHILVVEDEKYLRQGLKQLLELEDYEVTCAADGIEGWQQVERSQSDADLATIDLVITDIKMPRCNGLELLSKVHDRFPDLPVIIITGHGDMTSAVEALRSGAYDFITKPFELEIVLAAVKRALEKLRMKKELESTHKLASLGILAAGMAHELNNPLTVITGATEHMLDILQPTPTANQKYATMDGPDLASLREYLDMTLKSAHRCTKIIEALKIYARAESPLEQAECDLNAIVQNSVTLTRAALSPKNNVRIEIDLSVDLPPILGDANKLTQVFINLIANAYDAMQEGGIIRLATRVENETVIVTVTDTGTGIPADVLTHIFDPFFTTKEVGKGTGLGLSIVSGIVQEHGGKLQVESQVERGTTFTLKLPVNTSYVPEPLLSTA